MNRHMQMRKDEFRNDDEKDVWQQGYIASVEGLTDLHQDLPVNPHRVLCAGWWCAFEDATKCLDNRLGTSATPPITSSKRAMGRGLNHFRQEGARLIPEPTEPDLFVEEAYRLWTIKQQGK